MSCILMATKEKQYNRSTNLCGAEGCPHRLRGGVRVQGHLAVTAVTAVRITGVAVASAVIAVTSASDGVGDEMIILRFFRT